MMGMNELNLGLNKEKLRVGVGKVADWMFRLLWSEFDNKGVQYELQGSNFQTSTVPTSNSSSSHTFLSYTSSGSTQ